MASDETLSIDYIDHEAVTELIDVITYCVEGISLSFDRWDEPYVQGPGLYFVVVAGTSIEEYADPMGENRWPTDECPSVSGRLESFYDVARSVALERDGAVVVTVDGTIHEQMVRLKDLSADELEALPVSADHSYAEWMGARHMSAMDTSAREEVVATVTLSEESGRVSIFQDGDYVDFEREEIGGVWRADS
ncbi:hypothetical protein CHINAEXTREME_10340 [Halobiforma lacisalsi AJ5]|uniref:DAC domain-containing protein n=2 Tax=Natronobacterium TaxID=2256 RepID=M0L6T4_NATLA|nr:MULTISPECIES: diadenylate cyclase [Halobiforma]APW98162.1 hypothetical protein CHINAEXTREME_10340 [Halobiforma lacisalsi AJ5]EMA28144.1 hypothetical protein C445_18933 [Halobiforma lacisalsi AJ5]SFC42142.1 DisA checkpoint controller nucleotide-binding [Halobiforma haloterrestris]